MSQNAGYKMRCPSCRTKNRIPENRIGQNAKCGKCGNSFATDVLRNAQSVLITDGNFGDMVLRSPLPVLIFSWAPW